MAWSDVESGPYGPAANGVRGLQTEGSKRNMSRSARARWTIAGAAFGGILFAMTLAPRQAPAQALSGLDVYRSNCDGCHELYDPENPKRTRAQWETILTRMVKVRGATLNQQEFGTVLNYLDSFNRPRREIQWVESPAKSHRAAITPADAGKLPPEWVDLTVGTDEHIPWSVQGNPAAKSAFLSPLKAAGENQFPVLIDNTGTVQNGAAATRVQIVSGKGALGAGIVFGFRSPQSYYGARIGARDVVLYELQNGERALLGRAPLALPLKQWHTLGLDVDGKSVKVTVNGKPAISQTLEGYRGGRMGIHTQGDTVALFDQWQVTVR